MLGLQLAEAKRPDNLPLVTPVSVFRLITGPMVGMVLVALLGLTGPARQAAILESAMPTAAITTNLAVEYDIDPVFVTGTVLVSLVPHASAPPVVSNPQSALSNQQSAITIDSSTVSHTFGQQITFTLSAHGESDITTAALLMRVGDNARTDVIDAAITPGQRIETRVTLDLQSKPMPPFAIVIYSWRLADAAGQTLDTPQQTYLYDDNRFAWQTIERGAIAAHWYDGDLAFGQSVADIGYQALDRVSRFIGATPPAKVNVYVYADAADLQSGLSLSGRTWVGGHADPELGVVLVAAPATAEGLLQLNSGIPHELAHVMIYQAVGPAYDTLPVWLDEGLAVNSELEPEPYYSIALAEAVKSDTLLPLDTLCSSFSVDPSIAQLSYAESESVVRYILDRWGSSKMSELLAAYRDGATCEGGVQRALGLTLAELQTDWQHDVLEANPTITFLRNLAPALCVFCPVALILAVLVFVPKRSRTQINTDEHG